MKNEKILFDNYNINNAEYYSLYKQYCIDFEEECHDQESYEFFSWVYAELDFELECFFKNLAYDKVNNADCVVLGDIGRWNGRFDIEPTRIKTLSKAIENAIKGCDYFVIKQINGVIAIKAIHHDGVNNFTIHKLNKKSNDLVNQQLLYKKHYHSKFNIEF